MNIPENKLLNLMMFDTSRFHINKEQYDLCAEYISAIFSDIGFNIEIEQTALGKIIIGKRFQDEEYSHVHFSGHYDVVTPTFGYIATYNSEKKTFSGRGCSDMKGGIISVWMACKEAIKSKINCNYSFSFSPDEETGGQVATTRLMDLIPSFLPYDSLVIIADSSYPKVIVAHRGAYWVNVKISLESTERFAKGKISAFEIMCSYYKEFMETPENIEMLGMGGLCSSSEVVNMWTHTVSFSLDYRFSLPKTVAEVKKWVEEHLSNLNITIKNNLNLTISPLSWDGLLEVEPCGSKNDINEYLATIKEVIPEASTENGRGFYDLRLFRNAGYDISFVLGPGDIWNAHVKDEILPAKNINDCAMAYLQLIEGVANGQYNRIGEAKV